MTCARGQATVEVVAMLPLLLAIALAVSTVLAAGRAREVSGAAAQAGAMALLDGKDARVSARDVVPASHRPGLRVRVHGRRVTVEVAPPLLIPRLGPRLASTSSADAGPETQR